MSSDMLKAFTDALDVAGGHIDSIGAEIVLLGIAIFASTMGDDVKDKYMLHYWVRWTVYLRCFSCYAWVLVHCEIGVEFMPGGLPPKFGTAPSTSPVKMTWYGLHEAVAMQLTFTAGFGGGAASAMVLMQPQAAPINMFSSKIDLMWTIVWWTCNYFPYNIPGRIVRWPPIFEVCKLLLVVGSGGVMCTRVDQVLKFYPSSTIAALIVGVLSLATFTAACPSLVGTPDTGRTGLRRSLCIHVLIITPEATPGTSASVVQAQLEAAAARSSTT